MVELNIYNYDELRRMKGNRHLKKALFNLGLAYRIILDEFNKPEPVSGQVYIAEGDLIDAARNIKDFLKPRKRSKPCQKKN